MGMQLRDGEEKRICKSTFHPFKQKYYRYNPEFDHPEVCSTCAHTLKMTQTMIMAVASPTRSLYGDEMMQLPRSIFHQLVDQVYDQIGQNK